MDLAALDKIGTDAIYAAVGLEVVYRIASGIESTVTIIPPEPRNRENVGHDRRAPDRSRVAAVRLSEIASPARGDRFTIAGGTHKGVWSVDAVESNDGIEAVLVVH